jgi:hypothetical protein
MGWHAATNFTAEHRFDNSFVANVHIILADIGNKNET